VSERQQIPVVPARRSHYCRLIPRPIRASAAAAWSWRNASAENDRGWPHWQRETSAPGAKFARGGGKKISYSSSVPATPGITGSR